MAIDAALQHLDSNLLEPVEAMREILEAELVVRGSRRLTPVTLTRWRKPCKERGVFGGFTFRYLSPATANNCLCLFIPDQA